MNRLLVQPSRMHRLLQRQVPGSSRSRAIQVFPFGYLDAAGTLLEAPPAKDGNQWTVISYWKPFFEITSEEVSRRPVHICALCSSGSAHLPPSRDRRAFSRTSVVGRISSVRLLGRHHCLGPLWITTTVAIELFVLYASKTVLPAYSSLGTALLGFYGLAFALPSIIWLAINSWDVSEANITGITLSECISLSGYSLVAMIPGYIPVVLHSSLLSSACIVGAACYSAYFLYRNLWPVLRASPMIEAGKLKAIMLLWMANHVVIILLLSLVFLH